MMPTRLFALVVLGFSLVMNASAASQASQGTPSPAGRFDSQPWLEDFNELTAAMASHYADLDWAINDRHLDLPKLRQETEEEISKSSDELSARSALWKFLDAFGDGHLSVTWPDSVPPSSVVGAKSDASLCGHLGYQARPAQGIDFSLLPGFRRVDGEGSEFFPGGLLRLRNGVTLGLVRIPLFDEHAFPEACQKAVREMQFNESKCDKDCEHKLSLGTANLLTAEIVKRAEQFRGLGASALLVDVTNNDGGGDWVEAVSRSLSSIPLTEDHMGFIKHEHWTTEFESRLHDVETDLRNGAAPRSVLEEAAKRLRLAIDRSKESCDRSRVFVDGKLNCSLAVNDLLFWSGILPYAKPGSFPSLESRTTLFHPLRYTYSENPQALALYVVVDRKTWSSAERFASLLQDNSAATIIGELTGGAGCGFTNGSIPTTLSHSGAKVKIPDCVGLRKDGSNGNDGVIPDVLVPWAMRDTPFTRATKLLRSLDRAAVKTDGPK